MGQKEKIRYTLLKIIGDDVKDTFQNVFASICILRGLLYLTEFFNQICIYKRVILRSTTIFWILLKIVFYTFKLLKLFNLFYKWVAFAFDYMKLKG